uniref:glycosyltransferase n=1 Tax=Vibrio harveyi TaxID=669 RepID=UPI000AD02D47
LPQTATEAQACGTPVVAFDTTGLSDVIEHKKTGYLVVPFDTDDLAKGIEWCTYNNDGDILSKNAIERAKRLWDSDKIALKYNSLFLDVLG